MKKQRLPKAWTEEEVRKLAEYHDNFTEDQQAAEIDAAFIDEKDVRIDTTIADIHKTRERISDAFGGDIGAITLDAQKRQEQSGRKTVSFAKIVDETLSPAGNKPVG